MKVSKRTPATVAGHPVQRRMPMRTAFKPQPLTFSEKAFTDMIDKGHGATHPETLNDAALVKKLGTLSRLEEMDDYLDRENGPRKISLEWLFYRGFWRTVIETLGAGSEYIHIGRTKGYVAGFQLQKTYENEPRGRGIFPFSTFGKMIDRYVLNRPEPENLRQRRDLLLSRLKDHAVQILRTQGELRYFDPAAGTGTYGLEVLDHALRNVGTQSAGGAQAVLAELLQALTTKDANALETLQTKLAQGGGSTQPIRAQFRDISPYNVAKGNSLIAEKGFGNMATFERGDAFNYNTLAALKDGLKPNLVSVSGFWELFSDNLRVYRSIAGIFEAMAPGGIMAFTAMPRHKDIKFCAYSLRTRSLTEKDEDGDPVTHYTNMPLRTKREIEGLVRAAGFNILDSDETKDGYFTAHVAQKPE